MTKDKVSCSISMMFSLGVVGFFALSTLTFIRPSGSIYIYPQGYTSLFLFSETGIYSTEGQKYNPIVFLLTMALTK